MDHPFISLKSLTEDQLLDNISKCRRALAMAERNQQTFTDSLRTMLATYEEEYQERLYETRVKDMNEQFNKKYPGDTIEIGSVTKPTDDENNE